MLHQDEENDVSSGRKEDQNTSRARRISIFGILPESRQSVFDQEYFDRNPARFLRLFARIQDESNEKLNTMMHQIFDFPKTGDPMLLNVATTGVREKVIKNFRTKYILEGQRKVIVDVRLARWIIENGGLVTLKYMNPVISNTRILVVSYAYLIADKYGFQHTPRKATESLTKQMIDDLGDLVEIPEQYEYDIHTWVANFSRITQNNCWLMKWAMDCGVVRGPVSDSFMNLMKARLSYIIKRRIRSFDEDAMLSEKNSEELSRAWRDYYRAYLASAEGRQDLVKYNFTDAMQWYLENVQDEEIPEDLPKIETAVRSRDRDSFPTKWNFDLPCTRIKKELRARSKSPRIPNKATTPKTNETGTKEKYSYEDDSFDKLNDTCEAFDMSAMSNLLQNSSEELFSENPFQSDLEASATSKLPYEQLQEMKKLNNVCMLLIEDLKKKASLKEPVDEQLDLLADHFRRQNILLNNEAGINTINTSFDIQKEVNDDEEKNNNSCKLNYRPDGIVPTTVEEY